MTPHQRTIVAEARSWVGTPFHHQSSIKHVGADCLGVLRGVWRSIHGQEPCVIPSYAATWDEVSKTETLWRHLGRILCPIPLNSACSGDVVLFRMREGAVAKHIGILSQTHVSFIHAYGGHGVVESNLTLSWQRRIVASFRIPKGES